MGKINNKNNNDTSAIEKIIFDVVSGSAIGDALAAATDGLSESAIVQEYGHDVTDFEIPSDKCFSAGRRIGQVTDVFSIPYFLMSSIIENDELSKEVALQSLSEWADTDYSKFAGMTTRPVIEQIKDKNNTDPWAFAGKLGSKIYKGHYYALSSNGSIKAWVAGLGELENMSVSQIVADAVEIALSSHDDNLSISAVVSVALSMSAALRTNSIEQCFDSAIDGAFIGEKRAELLNDIWDYPGPSMHKRLCLARKTVYSCRESLKRDRLIARKELRDIIGCGPEVTETVPLALGLLLAHKDDPMAALVDAVNVGDETCACASLVGAYIGALYGDSIWKDNWVNLVEQENGFAFSRLARDYAAFLIAR